MHASLIEKEAAFTTVKYKKILIQKKVGQIHYQNLEFEDTSFMQAEIVKDLWKCTIL